MLRTRVAIPVVALYSAWQVVGLPDLHRALLAEVDFDEDRVADGDVSVVSDLFGDGWGLLERHGLAQGRQVHPDFARSLRLIAEAGTEYYAFFNQADSDATRSVLVSVAGDEALRVVATPDKRFVLEPVRADEAPQALIAALPEIGPGRGGVISIPADAMNDKPMNAVHDQGGASFLQPSRPAPDAHSVQVRQLRKIMGEQRLGGGQVFAARRDGAGRKRRCTVPLAYSDTVTGRYQWRRSSGSGGVPWLTVQPADVTSMTGALRQLAATM